MAFMGMFIVALLGLMFLFGLIFLFLGAFRKEKRKRFLIAGCVLCAPLLVFILFILYLYENWF